jgi:hypothetical protein
MSESDGQPMLRVTIVGYGGSARSVQSAFKRLGVGASITLDHGEMLASDGIVLPGNLSFGQAMAQIRTLKLKGVLGEALKKRTPVLGIGVGMQLLTSAPLSQMRLRDLACLPARWSVCLPLPITRCLIRRGSQLRGVENHRSTRASTTPASFTMRTHLQWCRRMILRSSRRPSTERSSLPRCSEARSTASSSTPRVHACIPGYTCLTTSQGNAYVWYSWELTHRRAV